MRVDPNDCARRSILVAIKSQRRLCMPNCVACRPALAKPVQIHLDARHSMPLSACDIMTFHASSAQVVVAKKNHKIQMIFALLQAI